MLPKSILSRIIAIAFSLFFSFWLAFGGFATTNTPPETVTFFVAAHQDDWQLFMNPTANQEMQKNAKVVFIYLTAGDKGLDTQWWQARREGALRSVQFAKRQRFVEVKPATNTYNGHPIASYDIDSTRSFFLNLPDGNCGGAGFANTNYQSLKTLHDGKHNLQSLAETSTLQTTYTSWQDLVTTVQQIIESESGAKHKNLSWIHFIDPATKVDGACNTGHSDHQQTGMVVQDAITHSKQKYQQAKFLDYSTRDRKANVVEDDLAWKAATYFFYTKEAFDRTDGKYAYPDFFYLQWLQRQYRTN